MKMPKVKGPKMTIDVLRGAVARGWCHDDNSEKEMDVNLAEAITQEVWKLWPEHERKDD